MSPNPFFFFFFPLFLTLTTLTTTTASFNGPPAIHFNNTLSEKVVLYIKNPSGSPVNSQGEELPPHYEAQIAFLTENEAYIVTGTRHGKSTNDFNAYDPVVDRGVMHKFWRIDDVGFATTKDHKTWSVAVQWH